MHIQLPSIKLAYTDTGPDKQGFTLLFVHGYPLNRQMWQPQVEGLADVARVLTIDLRGHGESEIIPGPYSMDLFASDLHAFLEALNIHQPIVLCGLSMGGYVTFAFQRRYPNRLAGLILTATRAAADSLDARAGRDQSAALARSQGTDAIIEGMLPRLLSPQTQAQRPDLVAQARAIMEKTSLETILGDLAGLKERPDFTSGLAQIDIPTLLLPGAEDRIVPLSEAQAMHAAIPDARLHPVPGAGHLPNLENASFFNQAVRDFVQRLK